MTAVDEYTPETPPPEAYESDPAAAPKRQWVDQATYRAQRQAELEEQMAAAHELALARARKRLRVVSAAELRAEQSKVRRRWLVEGVIAEDHYGVLGASPKSLKSWTVMDLAVAVASGGKWLGLHRVAKSGPVVFFAGEGGAHELWRRLEAVASHHGHDLAELPVYVVERVPHLNDAAQMEVVREVLDGCDAVLMVLDPAYLAARGGESSNLISMGELLEELQNVVLEARCALMVVHHWNKTGQGDGANRFSGAAWAEWGRFLISVKATPDPAAKPGHTKTKLAFDMTGGSVAGTTWAVDVEVWASDPADLNSPLHYRVAPVGQATGGAMGTVGADERLRYMMELVSDYLSQCTGPVAKRTVEREVTGKAAAIRNALELLQRGDFVDTTVGPSNAMLFHHLKPYRRVDDPASEKYKPI